MGWAYINAAIPYGFVDLIVVMAIVIVVIAVVNHNRTPNWLADSRASITEDRQT